MAVTFTNNPSKLATPPEGTKVAADSIANVNYQIVKLDVGGLGSSVPLESSDGLPISPIRDFYFNAASGAISGYSTVNKFGEAPTGIQTTFTDIWSRANATPTQQIWLAPTAPRQHAIVADSSDDAVGGIGAGSVILYGLKTWDSAESSETVVLTGTTPVNTANSYVIIHRMKAIAQATTTNAGVNVGAITATAAAPDSTVTAVILAGDGQTEMAIYGVPSTKTAYLYRWSASINKTAAAAVTANFTIRVNENPNVQTLGYVRKMDFSIQSTGANTVEKRFALPVKFSGPCIIKVQAYASSADTDGNSTFDLLLVDN